MILGLHYGIIFVYLKCTYLWMLLLTLINHHEFLVPLE
jgi:hypothetical protein